MEDQTVSQITVVGGALDPTESLTGSGPKAPVHLTPAGLSMRKGKKPQALKLSEITRPLSESTKKIMMLG